MDIHKKVGLIVFLLIILSYISELLLAPLLSASSFWRLGQNVLLLVIFGIVVIRLFSSSLQQLADDLNRHITAPFKPYQHTDAFSQIISSPINKVIERHEKSFDDLANSIARLVPMSDELRMTYDAIAQKAEMQNSHSQVLELKDRADLSFPQKLALYEREITSLKDQFATERAKEYQALEVTLTADHTCRGRPSGTAKNCGFKCVERPNENMYTTDEWITYTGDSMGELKNEAKACLKLEARGKGNEEGRVSAVFKYRTSYIEYKIAKDADALFNSFLAE